MEVLNGNSDSSLGPDGLCHDCRFRRGQLTRKNWLLTVEIVLVGGLPAAMLVLQATGHFVLDGYWLALYTGGILVFAASAFGIRFNLRNGSK